MFSKTIIPEMDGFRAIAVIQVVVFHAGFYVWKPLTALISIGFLGVQLFFILSAFLLSLQFFQKGTKGFKPAVIGQYFFRRLQRIYPLFFISSLLLLGIYAAFDDFDRATLLEYFLFWRDIKINAVIWSLFVEMRFYLLLPLLTGMILILQNSSVGKWLVGMFFMIGLILVYAYRWHTHGIGAGSINYTNYATLVNADSFLWGIVIAWLYVKNPGFVLPGRTGNILVWTFIIILLIISMDRFYNFTPASLRSFWMIPLYNICFTGMMLSVLFMRKGWWNSMLSAKWMLFLSTISYSVYVWHLPIRNWMDQVAGYFADSPQTLFYSIRFIGTCSLTIIIGMLSYYIIEKPFLHRKFRFLKGE